MVSYIENYIAFDTNIKVRDGVKPLSSLNIGDEVFTYCIPNAQKEIGKVENKISGGSQELFKVETETHKIEATSNYPILCLVGDKNYEYKDVSEITTGDYLVVENEEYPEIPKVEKVISKESIGIKACYILLLEPENDNFYANGIVVHI